MSDIDHPAEPTVYLGLPDITDLLERPKEWVKNRRRTGMLLEPDVMVGAHPDSTVFPPTPGWSRERVVAYGKAVNVLDAQGNPMPLSPWLPPPGSALPDWWFAQRRTYLSTSDVGLLWGQSKRTVSMRLFRAEKHGYEIPRPAVRVGAPDKIWNRLGWTWDEVQAFSRRRGQPVASSWEQADLARTRGISLEEAQALLTTDPQA